jgi:fumarate reductase flavoprotein subunit
MARENSRGAHYRSDFPQEGSLGASTYTRVVQHKNGTLALDHLPVRFTRLIPPA